MRNELKYAVETFLYLHAVSLTSGKTLGKVGQNDENIHFIYIVLVYMCAAYYNRISALPFHLAMKEPLI